MDQNELKAVIFEMIREKAADLGYVSHGESLIKEIEKALEVPSVTVTFQIPLSEWEEYLDDYDTPQEIAEAWIGDAKFYPSNVTSVVVPE